MTTLTPYVIICLTLAAATLGLALGHGEERNIPMQAALATRLAVIDKWGKTLTIVTVVH